MQALTRGAIAELISATHGKRAAAVYRIGGTLDTDHDHKFTEADRKRLARDLPRDAT